MNNFIRIPIFIFLVFVLEIILYFGLKQDRDVEINSIKNTFVTKLNTQTNATLNYYNTTAQILVELILSDSANKKLIAQMNASEPAKTQARNELFVKISREYKIFEKFDFKQLHFHDKYGNSFLRFHKPDYFGDNLLEIRKTIKAVHDTGKIVRGFEEGKIVNGFRNVFPIEIDGAFIGSVELSNSFVGIISLMQKNYPYDFKLIIDKKDVESKLFAELIPKHYAVSTLSDDFYEEKSLKKIEKNKLFSKQTRDAIDSKIKVFKIFKNDKKATVFDIVVDSTDYIVTILPIQNFDKTITSYAVSYSKNDQIAKENKKFYLSFAFYNLAVLLILTMFLIRKYMLHGDEFSKKAHTDNLTGLPNRRKFESDLQAYIDHKKAVNLFLVMMDIDFFKNINDNFGHDTGDKILIEFGQVVKSSLRETDLIYRWGGEEFVLIFFSDDAKNIVAINEKIKNHIEANNFYEVGRVTCSFGIAKFEQNDTTETLVKKADKSLYAAKESGRNKVVML